MRINRIIRQYRRDFTAEYECQHCGRLEVKSGYDDDHFHNNVIPNMPCPDCGKTGGEVTSQPTVPAHQVL